MEKELNHIQSRTTNLERHRSKACIIISGSDVLKERNTDVSEIAIYASLIKINLDVDIKASEVADVHWLHPGRMIMDFLKRDSGSSYSNILKRKKEAKLDILKFNVYVRMPYNDTEIKIVANFLIDKKVLVKYSRDDFANVSVTLPNDRTIIVESIGDLFPYVPDNIKPEIARMVLKKRAKDKADIETRINNSKKKF